MSKTNAAPVDIDDADLDEDVAAPDVDDESDLWDDGDDDEPTDLEDRLDEALKTPAHVALADEFGAFVCADPAQARAVGHQQGAEERRQGAKR